MDAFDALINLKTLDLSFNRIRTLPPTLFVLKLPAMQTLYLQNNLLTEIDVWFFYLQSINLINLSNNQIASFKSRISWTPRNTSTLTNLLRSQSSIDMTNNNMTKFDDTILKEYKLCRSDDLSYFLKLMYTVKLTGNQFACTCDSYNLLMFYQTLIGESAITTGSAVFQTACSTPAQYAAQSIFTFRNSDECVGISLFPPIVYTTCVADINTGSGTILLFILDYEQARYLMGC